MLLYDILERKVLAIANVVTLIGSLDRHGPTLLLGLQHVDAGHLQLPKVATQREAQEEALHLVGVREDLSVAQLLEREDGLGLADEDLGLALAVLVGLEVEALEDDVDALLDRAVELREGAVAADAVAVEEVLVKVAVGVAGAAHAHVLQQTEVAHLMHHELVVKVVGALALVGLHAANVVRLAGRERLHQQADRLLDLGAGRRRAALVGRLLALGEENRQERAPRAAGKVDQVVEQQVAVLIQEAVDVVRHLRHEKTSQEGVRESKREGGGSWVRELSLSHSLVRSFVDVHHQHSA